VTPTLTPTPEPIVSLPIGTAALALLLVVVAIVLLVTWLTRSRGAATASLPPGVGDVPWLAALLDGLPQGALVIDPEGHPVAWNATAVSSLSLTSPLGELPLPLAALVTRALDVGTAVTTEVALSSGSPRRLRATALPLRAMGRTSGALVLVHDPAEGTGDAESYRRLIGAVAHELRTPLTAILGHADILGSCQPGQEEALWRRSRDFIASEADRLARLVEDLLTLTRLDLAPLQRRPVNLRAVAEEAISTLFQAAEVRGVSLTLQSPPALPRVLGDRDRLYQVFLNLLDNAVKYCADTVRPLAGGEAVVRLASEGSHVQVQVCDDGAGIAPEDLPYVFDPFYRSEGGRDRPGTGLGLTIVRTILEQHGATIHVQSAPGRGTTFTFQLPHARGSSSLPRRRPA
jgi:signal transduction histidine kinase